MENQAYIEEDQSRAKEQFILESCNLQSHHLDAIDDSDLFGPKTTTHIVGHVYEDVSIDTENAIEFSEQISFPDESRNTCEIKDRRSVDFARQAWISGPSSIVSPVVDKLFQHSSTLSSSVEISANRDSATSISFKTSDDDPARDSGMPWNLLSGFVSANILESVPSPSRENEDLSRECIAMQSDRQSNRRRKKKDCKHCRSKLAGAGSCEKLDELAGSKDAILKENGSNLDVSNFLFRESLLRPQNIKIYPAINRTSLRDIGAKKNFSAAFPRTSENGLHLTEKFIINAGSDKMLDEMAENNQNKILAVSKNGTDMRINSIYSQDRWYGKESPIFYTDVKDQNPFQRAYSLPTRTHTPTSQNRVNLRRSVRNDPPPHPARLDKHRRGWTLHLARPLKASGCSSSLAPLFIILLILLVVAGVALYIVFEPEKLQIIQQYLKSAGKLTGQNVTSGEPITTTFSNDTLNLTIMTTRITPTSPVVSADAFTMSALLNGDPSFPQSTSSSTGEATTEATSQNANATRYCDDCFESEVCVALVHDQVPVCRSPRDREDPTGCAGFCVINKHKCHRLDADAFRCVEIEHYCLDDEWTCSNTLCIPLDKRCDGHMNCYDHSDEFDCVCNLETHFQCGNETSCLPLERRCDGKIDCWDATDEINCTLGRNLGWSCPLDNEFTCSNGECILKVRFCDGLADCSDRSDEPHGCQGRCNKHEFTCQNGRCITKGMKCNGVDDCGDGTDERHCKNRFK